MDLVNFKVSSGFCCGWFYPGTLFGCEKNYLAFLTISNWLQSFNWSHNSGTMYQKRQNACVSMSLRESFLL